jgi:hypothetical protein
MLESLTITNQGLESIDFRKEYTPALQDISLDQCVGDVGGFHLDLPELRALGFNHIHVGDPTGFGPSLGRSPKLERVSAYKLWGLGVGRAHQAHVLVLPACEDFDLYRSDDLDHLVLWAPKLKSLNLQVSEGGTDIKCKICCTLFPSE